MAKTATITIQLIPESQEVNNSEITKEIIESLTCDWFHKILNIKVIETDSKV